MSVTALATSGVTVPVFRVGHEAARAEDAGDAAHLGHLVWGGDGGVEVEEAALDLSYEVVAADAVGASRLRSGGLLTRREHNHPGGLAGAVRQADRPAHHLVGLSRVYTKAHGDLDGGVELRRRGLGHHPSGLKRAVGPFRIDEFRGLPVGLAVLCHSSPRVVVAGGETPSHCSDAVPPRRSGPDEFRRSEKLGAVITRP
jgi:hypothetical protein